MITNAIIPSFEGVIAFILGWIITGFYDKTVIDKKKKYLHKMKLNRHGLRPNLSHIFLSIIMHGTRQINIVL